MDSANYFHLQELNGLEMIQAQYHHQKFSRHTHEGFCIGVMEDGAQQFFRTGENHYAPKGDIIIINADEIHTGSSAVANGWAYKAIYPTPEMFERLTLDLNTENYGVTPWFPNAVIHDSGLASQLSLLFDLLLQPNNTLLKETLLLSSMSWLILKYNKSRLRLQDITPAKQSIQNICDLMMNSAEQEHSLTELATIAGFSQWHFLRQFKLHTGTTPHVFLIQARLYKAKKLLLQGLKPADVSSQCGFSDQSHFTRHFKQAIGVTPGQYIQHQINRLSDHK
ncbi:MULTISPECIES: AraC family transcriptional regulator [Providencia]|uniref:Arabinose operon regulatory protein n=3 Tax=Providencia TaxID=586 RepID=A0A1S1HNZ4_PROST|nr:MULTISPECIES: AraC family transcriptional regulator [Providencia]MDV5225639.1 AraC family transcriptional regulator [Providencia rettgeri]MDW7587129.1 AraC family transcriptional regulator [Providencia sp. 2023EL-00965]MDX4944293.1 AraC family transcriptional regulator [Providencia manganoxydans]OHT23757.1 AraC family transcriptional regulator [Providencia stuartii]